MTARLTLEHAAYTRFNAQSSITMGATVAALSHSAGVFSAIVDLFFCCNGFVCSFEAQNTNFRA